MPDDHDALIERLEHGLVIDRYQLEEALQDQPLLFYEVSEALTLAASQKDAAKSHLEEVKASIELDYRQTALDNKEKLTEHQVDALVKTSHAVVKATKTLLQHNDIVGRLSALKESYSQRSFMLRSLIDLYISNYYSDATNSSARRQVRESSGDETRRAIDAERRRRE